MSEGKVKQSRRKAVASKGVLRRQDGSMGGGWEMGVQRRKNPGSRQQLPGPGGVQEEPPEDRFSFVVDETEEPGNVIPVLAALLIALSTGDEKHNQAVEDKPKGSAEFRRRESGS
jgi:hypothetical protein